MEYRRIMTFKFKNQKYQLLLDKYNKYFFLRINEYEKYEYITLDELLQLEKIFCYYPLTMKIVKDGKNKMKFTPKVLISGILTTLTLTSFLAGCSSNSTSNDFLNMLGIPNSSHAQYEEAYERKEPQNQVSFDTEDGSTTIDISGQDAQYGLEDSDENFEVETYLESDWLNYLYIYDMDYLDKALDYDTVTVAQIHDAIDNNPKINDKFATLMHSYVDDVAEKQPDAELRVLYENLKTLEVVECDKDDLMLATLSVDSAGCYVRTENKIYVLKDYEYKEGTWEYQVIYHELSHVLRTGTWDNDDEDIRVQCEGLTVSGVTTSEALNSLFAVSLFDYDEKDIAYQLQSNYYKVMIENMDNYKLSDYVNHSLSYFVKKLDEQNGNNNYAKGLLELIETQYKDYHDDSFEAEQEEYYPIYDYIAKMYYAKHIASDMTYSDAENVTAQLLDEIMFDVPEEYHIDTNHFYDYLKEYCQGLGIETPKSLN